MPPRAARRAPPPPRLQPAGLRDGTLDVAELEEKHRGLEEQLQRDADSLRAAKDQNAQARQALQDTSAQIATMHQQFDQVPCWGLKGVASAGAPSGADGRGRERAPHLPRRAYLLGQQLALAATTVRCHEHHN